MFMDIQMRKKLIVLCILIIFFFDIFCFSGCINQNDTVSSDSSTLNIGLNAGEYNITYPFKGYYTQQMISINSNIYNSLVEFDENFNIIPSLAQSWYNPSNYTWRFNLRKDVKFHNGYNLTAEDIKYTMEKIKEDKNNSIFLHFSVIDEIKIINDYTLEMITKVPDPLLLRYLTYVYIISEEYFEQFMNIPPIGTGPYKFYNYIENDFLILKGFNDYWGGKPTYNDVTISFYNTFEDKLEAVCNGDVDIIDSSEKTDINNLSKIYGIKMISISNPNVFYLSFDFRKNNSCCFENDNPVADVRIRKAMYHAIDINDIVENNTYVFAVPATQFVNEYIIGYNPNVERLTYDLDLARMYMTDAGYEHGFEIDLDCRDLPFIIDMASRIASQLAEINITVNLNVLPRSEYITKVYINRNSSLYITG